NIRGIAWDAGGRLIIGSHSAGLWRVPATGGAPEELTNAERTPPHRYPHVLPGGRGILFEIFGSGTSDSIAVLPEGGKRWRVLTEGQAPVFVPPDHLVFSRPRGGSQGDLWSARFDLKRLQLSTEPMPLNTLVQW